MKVVLLKLKVVLQNPLAYTSCCFLDAAINSDLNTDGQEFYFILYLTIHFLKLAVKCYLFINFLFLFLFIFW